MSRWLLTAAIAAAAIATAAAAAGAAEADSEPMLFLIFTQRCFDVFFTDGLLAGSLDIFDVACIKLTISKALGYGIVVFSGVLKAPQIYNIVKNRDATGISPSSFYLDAAGYTVSPVYGFMRGLPISTYGETFIILVQNLVLVLLLWRYSADAPPTSFKLGAAAAYAGFAAAVVSLPPQHLHLLPMLGTAMVLYSRVPQIYSNFSQGHTGQLAIITWLLNLIGVIARVFTTWAETDDMILLGSHCVGVLLNLIIVVQIIAYRQATKDALAGDAAAKGAAEGGSEAAAKGSGGAVRRSARQRKPVVRD